MHQKQLVANGMWQENSIGEQCMYSTLNRSESQDACS